MAKAVSDEQVELRRRARRRLIGAITLVTVVAVVLPWVLETEPKSDSQDVSIQIPSPDTGVFGTPSAVPRKPAETGMAVESPPAGTQSAEALKADQDKLLAAPTPKSAAARAPAGSEAKPKSAPASAAKPPAAARESAVAGEQFVVQVAALADADKAKAIRLALERTGLKAYTEAVKTAKGEVTRVRVGPFATRQAAEDALANLRGQGFDGHVTAK